jgi:hypothetical protein
MPEFYGLDEDPGQQANVWEARIGEGAALGEDALAFLERLRTPELYLAPRRLALQRFAPDFVRSPGSTMPQTQQNQMQNASEEAV